MKTIRFDNRRPVPRGIRIGVEADNNVEQVKFELPSIRPGQTETLYWRNGEYADAVALSDGVWTITNAITSHPGEAVCYIAISDWRGTLWHSEPFSAFVIDLPGTEQAVDRLYPSAIQTAVDMAAASNARLDEACAATLDALKNAPANRAQGMRGRVFETLRPAHFEILEEDHLLVMDGDTLVSGGAEMWEVYRYAFGERLVVRLEELAAEPTLQARHYVPLAYELDGTLYPLDEGDVGAYFTADALLMSCEKTERVIEVEGFQQTATDRTYTLDHVTLTLDARRDFENAVVCAEHMGEFDGVVCFGDGVFYGYMQQGGAQIALGNGVAQQFARLMGLPLTNCAATGATLTTGQTTPWSVVQQVRSWTPAAGTTPLVILNGGMIDQANWRLKNLGAYGSADTDTVYGAIRSVISDLLAKGLQPWQIVIVTPFPKDVQGGAAEAAVVDAQLTAIGYAMYQTGAAMGCNVINGYRGMFGNLDSPEARRLMMEDGAHPTELGAKVFAHDLYEALGGQGRLASSIADRYDPPYAFGDRAMIEGRLKRALQDIPAGEPYTPGHWSDTSIMEELGKSVSYAEGGALNDADSTQAVKNIRAVGVQWNLGYTEDQKQAARSNIGLPLIDWLVDWSDTQKMYARMNIGARRQGIMPEDYGAKADGVTDDSSALLWAFSEAYRNGLPVSLDEGKIYCTSRDLYLYNRVHVYGNGACIKATGAIRHILYINDSGDSTQSPPIPPHGQFPDDKATGLIENLTFDCNGLAETGIFVGMAKAYAFQNIYICGFTLNGMRIQSGYGVMVNNLWVAGGSGTETIGVNMWASDAKFTNVTFKNVATGISNHGYANHFDHIHHWNIDAAVAPVSVMFDAWAGFIATNCYVDTCAKAVKVHRNDVNGEDAFVEMYGTYILPDNTRMNGATPVVFDLEEAAQAARVKSFGMVYLAPGEDYDLFNLDAGQYARGFPWAQMNDESVQTMGNFPEASDRTAALESAISSRPKIVDTDADTDGIDLIDDAGYVAMRLSDGHVQTKAFDSAEALGDISSVRSAMGDRPRTVDTDAGTDGIDLIDDAGYVVMRLSDGHVQTKNFDSAEIQEDIADLDAAIADNAAAIESNAGDTAALDEVIDLLLGEHEIIHSPNLYDPALQTPATISPHYYVNGVPYSTEQFDNTWNCTAPIPVAPNTTYTVGLVPAMDGETKPWGSAAYGWFLYDENDTYLTQGSGTTFTTGAAAAHLRFNYCKGVSPYASLDEVNARCMLVKGNSLPAEYMSIGDKLTSDLQDQIDEAAGFEWKFSGGDLLLAYGYNDTQDAVVVMNAGRANGLFDFAALALKPKGTPLADLETGSLTAVWNSGTDMHAPFQFLAVNNADGYHASATSAGFTGGNHTLDDMGSNFKTASSKYIYYFADGRPVSSGNGKCMNFEIRWANGVQAYNTVKQGGGGRECLIEYHNMIFDGVRFNEQIRLMPTEAIKMALWYGLQFVSFGTKYTNIAFRDGANRQTFASTDSDIKSGNAATSAMLAWGDEDGIELTVDTGCDLGKRTGFYSGDRGAFTSSSKGYFTIIGDYGGLSMAANNNYFLKGSFRFYPAVSQEGE